MSVNFVFTAVAKTKKGKKILEVYSKQKVNMSNKLSLRLLGVKEVRKVTSKEPFTIHAEITMPDLVAIGLKKSGDIKLTDLQQMTVMSFKSMGLTKKDYEITFS